MPSYRRLKAVGIAGLITVLLSSLTMGAFAEGNGEYGDVTVQDEEEALQYDAEFYADQFDVDVETAKRNLQLQGPAGELQAELYENEADTYAGQWLDHGDEFRLIVWFTDGDAERLQQYDPSDALSDAIEIREAEYSWAELREQQETAMVLVDELSIPTESSIDIRENRVELWVTDQQDLESTLSDAHRELPEAVRVVEVDELTDPESLARDTLVGDDTTSLESSASAASGPDVYGGLDLQPVCTTGFAVEHESGARGFLSAGHCQDSQQIPPNNWSLLGQTTPLQDFWYQFQLDVQWHTVPSHTLRNWALVSNDPPENPTTRLISGEVPLLQQPLGGWVCGFGAVTNYQTCGQIQEIDYQPSWSSCSCFVRVQHPDGFHLGQHGDSGGPWYSGNDAYGILSVLVGGSFTNVAYMPTSSAAGVPDLTVLTWCPSTGC